MNFSCRVTVSFGSQCMLVMVQQEHIQRTLSIPRCDLHRLTGWRDRALGGRALVWAGAVPNCDYMFTGR